METEKVKNSELISYISHEIKNSLNPVINLSGVMLKEKLRKLNNDEREYLQIIERNGRKILVLVDCLSYINRCRTGKIVHSFVPLSIKTVIENSVNFISSCLSDRLILSHCISAGGGEEVPLEPESFKKIISCITGFFVSLNNPDNLYFRMKSLDKSLTINISLLNQDEWTIRSEENSKSFDPSSLSETSLLWYSLAGEMISIAGGQSDIRQFSDGRSAWMLTLPLPGHAALMLGEDLPVDQMNIREFVLMVIDDDPDTLIPLKAIAEHEFGGMCHIVHAMTGSEGIDLLGRQKPDIILLDLTLPDINGIALIRNIRNFFAKDDVVVIAFTGHDLGFNREKLISSGFDDIIIKPFNIDEFVAKIKSWVN